MGYPFEQKAYKLLNLETRPMFTSRDVIFHEQVPPYHSSSSTNGSTFFPQSQSFEPYCSEAISPSQTKQSPPVLQHDEVLPEQATTSANPLTTRRSGIEHKTPSHLSEYVCSSVVSQQSSLCCPNTVSSICCNVYLNHDVVLSSNASNLLQQLDFYSEPTSYEEAPAKP